MESEKKVTTQTPEHQPPEASSDLEYAAKAEALRNAELLGDEYVQLAEVIGGRMPGCAIAEHIDILKGIDFGTTAEFDLGVEDCVNEAIRLSRIQYDRALVEAITDANRLLDSRPGVFSLQGIENSTLMSLDIQPDEKGTICLYLQTASGVIVSQGAILIIDFTKV